MKKFIITAFIAVAGVFAANAQTVTPQQPENKNQAEATFDKEVHDFGIIPQGVPATVTFYFKNTGKEPLIIKNAAASCGCTTPEWSKEPIKPGQKGFVKATYNAAAAGSFTKNVTVTSNGKKEQITLTLKGEVKPAGAVPASAPAPAEKK